MDLEDDDEEEDDDDERAAAVANFIAPPPRPPPPPPPPPLRRTLPAFVTAAAARATAAAANAPASARAAAAAAAANARNDSKNNGARFSGDLDLRLYVRWFSSSGKTQKLFEVELGARSLASLEELPHESKYALARAFPPAPRASANANANAAAAAPSSRRNNSNNDGGRCQRGHAAGGAAAGAAGAGGSAGAPFHSRRLPPQPPLGRPRRRRRRGRGRKRCSLLLLFLCSLLLRPRPDDPGAPHVPRLLPLRPARRARPAPRGHGPLRVHAGRDPEEGGVLRLGVSAAEEGPRERDEVERRARVPAARDDDRERADPGGELWPLWHPERVRAGFLPRGFGREGAAGRRGDEAPGGRRRRGR